MRTKESEFQENGQAMTDHAHELRRYARKIAHPAGDVPAVMLAAADEIERLQSVIAGLRADFETAHARMMIERAPARITPEQAPDGVHDYCYEAAEGYADGWNDCIKSMTGAA